MKLLRGIPYDVGIAKWSEAGWDQDRLRFHSRQSAKNFLGAYMHDVFNMRAMRDLLAETINLSRFNDFKIVDLLAAKLENGEFVVVKQGEPATTGAPRQAKEPEPADADVAPPAVKKEEQITVVVTPKIDVEYRVVMLDRRLDQYQDGGQKSIKTDATCVEIWLEQDKSSPKFDKGAKLAVTGAGAIEFYEDQALTTKFDTTTPLPNARLVRPARMKLWAVGTKAGKCSLQVSVEKSGKPEFITDATATTDMGVVELVMEVHQQDKGKLDKLTLNPNTDPVETYYTDLKNLALPEQVVLSDENKIRQGRLLHVQQNDSFGRAKLVVKKLDGNHLPAGCDDYDIILNESNTSGGVQLCDQEFDGPVKPFPIKIKLSELKKSDLTFWAQGKAATKQWREVRLDLGLDRAKGGMAKTPKRNGDWALFTVVQIKSIEVHYAPASGKAAAWDKGKRRFYINFDNDPDGRKVTIRAELSEKLEGVQLHFMLAPDENNRLAANWGQAMPANWKWKDIKDVAKHKDKADRASESDPLNLLHLSENTDAGGKAEKELVLSRFGGDRYWPGCYTAQDPHLAKYVRGRADLEKRKPVLASHAIQVHRKFWYQPIEVQGVANPGAAGAIAKYRHVKAEMVAAATVSITKAAINAMAHKAIYPKYMISVGGGNADALVISDQNKADFFKDPALNAEGDKPVKIPLLICDAQWDTDGNTGAKDIPWTVSADFPIDLAMDKLVINPPLQGGDLFVSGTWQSVQWDGTSWRNHKNGNLISGDLTINTGRNSLYKVTVNLPSGAGAAAPNLWVRINDLVIKGASGPYLGEYDRTTKRILVVYEAANAADFQNTIAHELGHAFHQTALGNSAGEPAHANQYASQGSHCNYNTNKCLMYESGPIAGTLGEFCPVCHPYVILQNMSELA